MVRRIVVLPVLVSALVAYSASDNPSVDGWEDTSYRSQWFTYGVKSDSRGVKISSSEQFLLSPRYSAAVRKLVLKVCCNSTEPTRTLCVKPFVGGVESADESLWRTHDAVAAEDVPEYVHFDWDETLGIDALRICLGGSKSSGDWVISEIHVFYGEQTADEDEIVRDLVKELPAPSGLGFPSFTATSLSAEAGRVEFAEAYRFRVFGLEGTPRTVVREDFASAPEVSQGWTLTTENVKCETYATDSYYDTKSSDDCLSLKISKPSSSFAGNMKLEVVSPVLPAAATECSFMYRVGSVGKSDVFRVYGCDGAGGDWSMLAEIVPDSVSKRYGEVEIDAQAGIRQIKFVFEASGDDFSVAALDALAVVCGGDERRVPVGESGDLAEPAYSLSGLATGRYAVQVQAVAGDGEEYRDSEWSEEAVVDLAWSELVAGAPGEVRCETVDGRLRVTWTAAVNAAYYLVSVSTVGVPGETVIEDFKTGKTSVDLDVPDLGEYSVTVKACSPGGLASTPADPVVATLELGKVRKVSAEAVDRETLSAKWDAVAHAEGYRVRVFEICGGETMVEVVSLRTSVPSATVGGLAEDGRFVVEVSPLPSEGDGLSAVSEEVDLSRMRPREVVPVLLSDMVAGGYFQDFDALSEIAKETDLKDTSIPEWQLYKGDDEAQTLKFSATGKATAGGIYAIASGADSAARALGSLATGSFGCSFGIAFSNDLQTAVENPKLSFTAVQRSFKAAAKSYVLEWTVAGGEYLIGSAGNWAELPIPTVAPLTAQTCGDEKDLRQPVGPVEFSAVIPPGGTLMLRWRDVKGSSSPMMGVDDVRLECSARPRSLTFILR